MNYTFIVILLALSGHFSMTLRRMGDGGESWMIKKLNVNLQTKYLSG